VGAAGAAEGTFFATLLPGGVSIDHRQKRAVGKGNMTRSFEAPSHHTFLAFPALPTLPHVFLLRSAPSPPPHLTHLLWPQRPAAARAHLCGSALMPHCAL